ncbi:hypothetical protein [Massilia sp.]|uniref:hypothetical protein n=1 Tax=Massilia sp. TaxID=1882437 RepID=UPI00391AD8B2
MLQNDSWTKNFSSNAVLLAALHAAVEQYEQILLHNIALAQRHNKVFLICTLDSAEFRRKIDTFCYLMGKAVTSASCVRHKNMHARPGLQAVRKLTFPSSWGYQYEPSTQTAELQVLPKEDGKPGATALIKRRCSREQRQKKAGFTPASNALISLAYR